MKRQLTQFDSQEHKRQPEDNSCRYNTYYQLIYYSLQMFQVELQS